MTRERGVPADLHAAMLRCIEEVRQTTVNPERTATDRKSLASLWKAIGKPDAATFEEEFRAVARWARESEDKAAAGDIRGIGWKDNAGVDRHRDIATLCRQEKWGFRLELARKWVASVGSTATPAPADLMDNYRRLVGILCQRDDRRLIEGDDERHTLTLRYAIKLCGGRDAFRADPSAFLDRWPEVWAGAESEVAAKLAAMGQR